MIPFLKKISLFLLLILIVSYPAYYVLDLYQASHYTSKARWAMVLENKDVDYLLLGSSRIANTVDCHQLDSTLGSTTLNLATSGSSYGESYVLFNQYLARGNKTHTLILTFDLFKSKHSNWKAEALTPIVFKHYDLFPWYNMPDVRSAYKDHTEAWRMQLWQFLPISRHVEFNHHFKVDSDMQALWTEQAKSPFDTTNGDQLIPWHTFKGHRIALPGTVQLGPRGEKYLLKILALAKKNNIRVILVTAPYYQMKDFDRAYHTYYLDFLYKNYNTEYLDFSGAKEWQQAEYFADVIHMNDTGSKVFTNMLADSLKTPNP